MTKTLTVKDVPHSALGASSYDRWSNCAGSINLTRKVNAKNGSSTAADEGTAAHHLASTCLEKGFDAIDYLGYDIMVNNVAYPVDLEMANGVQLYLTFVWEKMKQYEGRGAVLHIERSLVSMLDDDAWGTADVTIEVPGDRIIVADFKYGRGVVAEPTSGQLRYYGYLALENKKEDGDFKVVELFIVQPRIPHPKGLIRRYVTNSAELTSWMLGDAIPAMVATRDPDAPLTVGDWCRFCPVRKMCPALRKDVTDFQIDLEPAYLTGEELGALLARKPMIIKAFADYEVEALKRVRQGLPVTGHKLVRKRGNRAWQAGSKVETAARKLWNKDAFTDPVLKSPAQMENLRGGKVFTKRWAFKPDAGLTLAPEDDKREAVVLTAEDMYGEIED